jgi:hypothetical protein
MSRVVVCLVLCLVFLVPAARARGAETAPPLIDDPEEYR